MKKKELKIARVIISGSRKFNDYPTLEKTVDDILSTIKDDYIIEIISGHASGADTLGEYYAKQHNILAKTFPADWDTYGRAAGPIRNEQMAKYASEADKSILIAFPIGESLGTRNMIKFANQYNIDVHVVEGQ